ncbi:MAG TPA: hypothetical protein VF160_10795 [Candidatus Dormibacteraeota bacterium]
MAEISVESAPTKSGWECDVEVDPRTEQASRHRVRVLHDDMARWGKGAQEPDALVRRAFQFLLEREPSHEILKSFELADISNYFPEFDKAMSG